MKINLRFAIDHLIPLIVSALFLLPFIWLISASLRAPGLPPPRGIEWIPDPIALTNYRRIFAIIPLERYLINSLIVSLSGALITLITSSWAGFGIAMLRRRSRRMLLLVSGFLIMIPIPALWLTRFLLFAKIGLTNSHLALIAPALMGSSPFFVLIFYRAFRRIDRSIFESAQIDGAGWLQTWAQIAIPLVRPALMAVGMLAFLLYWNDFINPILYLRSPSLYTLPIGLQHLQQMDKTNWSLLLAASVIMTLPALGVFALLQRALVSEAIRNEG
jgi:multiple sugar transport system permease protein